jgi:hypothetical protein
MLKTLRRLLTLLLFGPSGTRRLPPLNDEQNFMLQQYRMGLISEGEWHDLIDRDPVIAAHYRFHHPE